MSGSPDIRAEDQRRAESSKHLIERAGFKPDAQGLSRALQSPDLSIRVEAAFLLGLSPDNSGREALTIALGDQSARVRVESALALARHGDIKRAIPILQKELNGQFFEDAPLRAARALALLGDPSGYLRVLEALDSPLPSNRMEAIAVIPAFLRFDQLPVSPIDALVRAAGDAEPILRRDALTALADLDDERATRAIELAKNDPDAEVRALAEELGASAQH